MAASRLSAVVMGVKKAYMEMYCTPLSNYPEVIVRADWFRVYGLTQTRSQEETGKTSSIN